MASPPRNPQRDLRFPCPFCSRRYQKDGWLIRHLATVHGHAMSKQIRVQSRRSASRSLSVDDDDSEENSENEDVVCDGMDISTPFAGSFTKADRLVSPAPEPQLRASKSRKRKGKQRARAALEVDLSTPKVGTDTPRLPSNSSTASTRNHEATEGVWERSTSTPREASVNVPPTFPMAPPPPEVLEHAGEAVGPCISPMAVDWGMRWSPFADEEEYALARFFYTQGVSQNAQDQFLKGTLGECFRKGRGHSRSTFGSAHELRNVVDMLDSGLGWSTWNAMEFNFFDNSTGVLYHRDPLQCIEWLLRQPQYKDDMHYAPRKEYGFSASRTYSGMHTADWWWRTQVDVTTRTGRADATIVPVICASDQTHLTNFSGDKKAWPVYMTIGNIDASIRSQSSSHSTVLLALLPVAPKLGNLTKKQKDEHRNRNAEIYRQCINNILRRKDRFGRSLASSGRDGVQMDCSDGLRRLCFPILSAWIADYMENVTIHNIDNGRCPVCEIPKEKLGVFGHSAKARDHKEYELMWSTDQDLALKNVGVKPMENTFWGMPHCTVSSLCRPDILHTLYLGMMKHLLEWITGFLKEHKRLDLFDEIWLNLPRYGDIAIITKRYTAVSQWSGKDMRRFGRVVCAVLVATLQDATPAQQVPFQKAIKATRGMVEFTLLARYPSHNDETLKWMDAALKRFHTYKSVFNRWRVGAAAKATVGKFAKQLEDEMLLEAEAEVLAKASKGTRRLTKAKKQAVVSSARKQANQDATDQANYNFIKVHLLSHFDHSVREYGHIAGFSTEVPERLMVDLKAAYNLTNKNEASVPMLNAYDRLRQFSIREANEEALHVRDFGHEISTLREEGRSFKKVRRELPEAVAQTKISLVGHSFKGSVQQISIHHQIPQPGLWYFIKRYYVKQSRYANLLEVPEFELGENIRAFAATTWGGLKLPVQGFQDDDKVEMTFARCSSVFPFYRRVRNDFVWIRTTHYVDGNDPYEHVFRRYMPVRLRLLFTVIDPFTQEKLPLALVKKFTLANPQRPFDEHSQMAKFYEEAHEGVQDTQGAFERTHEVILINRIVSPAHLVCADPRAEPSKRKRWFVNPHVDHWTYNVFY